MSLKKCRECGTEISKTVRRCPQCGAYQWTGGRIGCLLIFVIMAIIFFWAMTQIK